MYTNENSKKPIFNPEPSNKKILYEPDTNSRRDNQPKTSFPPYYGAWE